MQTNMSNIFIVNYSNLQDRYDAEFYSPYYTIKGIRHFLPLKKLTTSIIHPPEYPREFSEEGTQLIRSQNVRPLGINLEENPVFFSQIFLENRRIIKPKIGDVLVVRSGVNAGDTAAIEQNYSNAIIGADTLLCKCDAKIYPKFLQVYFFTDLGKRQMTRHITGATNKHLNSSNLGKVQIPLLNLSEQIKCVDFYENAIKVKLQKENEAKALLVTIDDYLLRELGIILPEKDECLKSRIFTTQFIEVSGKRLDPIPYDINTRKIKKAITNVDKTKFKVEKLNKYVINSISGDWGIEEAKEDYTKCLVIRSTEFDNQNNLNLENNRIKYRYIKDDKLQKMDIQENDLLIEKSGGSPDQPVGRIAIITKNIIENNIICFSNFIHKIRVNNQIDVMYLFYYLRTIYNIGLTNSMQSQTNGIRNLIMNEYFNQNIILPLKENGDVDFNKQRKIVSHIRDIHIKAQLLQQEANDILEQAKNQIEKEILGETI
ncbi:restriction endonuclease subunit S [Bacteroides sp. 14(A)]|uniref:restriction endonuclease subunit S n=1 Tax=Bacteroides sp. 14(A) TaxID=1163670 RepID=UPI000493C217|nr:restriction endonuclease subunit S [Bacteroides sp. 14(A)]